MDPTFFTETLGLMTKDAGKQKNFDIPFQKFSTLPVLSNCPEILQQLYICIWGSHLFEAM
jgi:hypothetical protein